MKYNGTDSFIVQVNDGTDIYTTTVNVNIAPASVNDSSKVYLPLVIKEEGEQ